MNFLLFANNNQPSGGDSEFDSYRIEVFKPSLFKYFTSFEHLSLKVLIFRFYISLLTKFQSKIYFLIDEKGSVLHYSYLIRKNIKYSFLQKNEASIGPCVTVEYARGKGIYPYMLHYIKEHNQNLKLYLFIRSENESSKRGAIKGGFEYCGLKIKRTFFFHRFILE